MTTRRGFLKGILAAGVAPYVCTTTGVLMPVRDFWKPISEVHPFSSLVVSARALGFGLELGDLVTIRGVNSSRVTQNFQVWGRDDSEEKFVVTGVAAGSDTVKINLRRT